MASCCLLTMPAMAKATKAKTAASASQKTGNSPIEKQLTSIANQGDVSAQRTLGLMYANGGVVPKNDAKAVYWLKKAAAKNDARAQFALGVQYQHGRGVPQDLDKAESLLQKSAKQGYVRAEGQLGQLYSQPGSKQNDKKSLQWYDTAVNHDDVNAEVLLAIKYFNGKGVTQNYDKAFSLFQKAADHNDAYAQSKVGLMYLNGLGTKKDAQLAYQWGTIALNKATGQTKVDAQQVCDQAAKDLSSKKVKKAKQNAQEWLSKHGKSSLNLHS